MRFGHKTPCNFGMGSSMRGLAAWARPQDLPDLDPEQGIGGPQREKTGRANLKNEPFG